jgi:hypothetical protein
MIKIKRGSSKNWSKLTTPLADGQPGYDRESGQLKIGDGKTPWKDLPDAGGLRANKIFSSEADAKAIKAEDKQYSAIITFGKDDPDENTVGQLYLQQLDIEPEADRIISWGVNRGWTYRKWRSGIAECWCRYELTTSLNTSLDDSALFFNDTLMRELEYPISFTELPVETVTLQCGSAGVLLVTSSANSTDKSASYRLASFVKTTEARKFYFMFHVTGYWRR